MAALTDETKEKIIGQMLNNKTPEEIATELKMEIVEVQKYVSEYDRNNKNLVTLDKVTDLDDARARLQKDLNIVNNVSFIVDKLKSLLNQLEDQQSSEDNSPIKSAVREKMIYQYLQALRDFTNLNQWVIDRRIKMEEIVENQIYREALLDELKKESPEFAARVFARIQSLKKSKDLLI